MADTLLRDKARVLRSKGLSLNEISGRLRAPKSSVRYWCRDIRLSPRQWSRLLRKQKIGGALAAERMREQRIRITRQLLEEGVGEVRTLSRRELLLVGSALYWAEGYRKGDSEFGFTNSDPHMIRFMIHWLEDSCRISKDRIHLRVCINAVHKKRLPVIEKFWSNLAKVPLSQFSKPTLIRVHNKKHYLNSNEYFGTLRVKVRKSMNLRRKIMGWIEGLARATALS